MKKLIFLLLMAVFLEGAVFANDTPAHPLGVLNLEASLSGDNADIYAVITDTVLAAFLQVSIDKYDKFAGLIILRGDQYLSSELSSNEFASLVTAAINLLKITNQIRAVPAAGDSYLRC